MVPEGQECETLILGLVFSRFWHYRTFRPDCPMQAKDVHYSLDSGKIFTSKKENK